MKKLFILIALFITFIILVFGGDQKQPQDYNDVYHKALLLYNAEETSEVEDSLAVQFFTTTIHLLENKNLNDSILIDCYIKIGSLLIGEDKQLEANQFFNKVIAYRNQKMVNKVQMFDAYLYSGRTYYSLGNFDSAYYNYKKAEAISEKSADKLGEEERLYNVLGVLQYDYGNYKEAILYFNKALEELQINSKSKKLNIDLSNNYKINIASCYLKLQQYNEANLICDELLIQNKGNSTLENNINYKKVEINIGYKNYANALHYIKQVHYNDRLQLKVLNSFSYLYNQIGQKDSAIKYVQEAIFKNANFYANKNFDLAISYKNWGNAFILQNQYDSAIVKYQISINTFLQNYNNINIYSNPEKFSGSFSASELLDCLILKAKAFVKKYDQTKNNKDLNSGLDAYFAVFNLSKYLQNSYSSDDAKLFLSERKFAIHNEPIQICLKLFNATNDKSYFEKALYFDEENKSVVLNNDVAEANNIKNSFIPTELIQKELQLKQSITLLSIKLNTSYDTIQSNKYYTEINNLEFELAKVKNKIKNFEKIPETNSTKIELESVQNKMNARQVILSYHLSDTNIVVFVINKSAFAFKSIPINDRFINNLLLFTTELKNASQIINTDSIDNILYTSLIQPFENYFLNRKSITVIADDELHYLPFETLQNKKNELLISTYEFNYYTSYHFLFANEKLKLENVNVLAAAPFVSSSNNSNSQLASSGIEVKDIKGKKLLDSMATKSNLLKYLTQYKILHLATHATVNDSLPSMSFISLFSNDSIQNNSILYSSEIQNLDLSKTKLVYLSACETGAGKIVNGEGVMSLSRAFAYAGCPNVITSLWQADDASTAYITNQFYIFLNKGHTIAVALQMAKLAYLNDPKIEKRKKTPFYWAHLVFIGQIPKDNKSYTLLIGITFMFVALLSFYFYKKKSNKKTNSLFQLI